MRVLLDTNVLVSYLLTPAAGGSVASIMEALLADVFTLLLPPDLLLELERVATKRPHLARRIHPAQLARLRDMLLGLGETLAPIEEPIPAITRDRKDDYLLAYAFVGAADYLVTGDDDLLVLGNLGHLAILSPPAFAEQLRRAQ
jgi:putative PIN family toxin of toxin-antitoxin system